MATRAGKIFDVGIVESLNGGDLVKSGNDIAVVYDNENQIYLALFGGNVEANTQSIQQGLRYDYWANFLWDEGQQFNSNTERTLYNTALTSAGRLLIENAVKEDLKYLKSVSTTEVSVTIPTHNTVSINVRVRYNSGTGQVTVLTFSKRSSGDYSLIDYSNDYF